MMTRKVDFMKAVLVSTGKELADKVTIAESLIARMRGLLGKSELPEGHGLLIRPCKGIHTFFMKFAIDAVFLDADNRIVALCRDIPPNRATRVYAKAHAVLELPAGSIGPEALSGDCVDFT